jgi:spore coat polysaccharide biosynthesis predicted glycosyltransferase SpsG
MDSLRIAFRVDGDDTIGAGHVARCLPLARALEQLGHRPAFIGTYAGLARSLLKHSAVRHEPAAADAAAAGVSLTSCDAVVLDSYEIATADVCRLASRRPLATLAESCRCPHAGVLLDYHLDRIGEIATERLLPGPDYAPIDPRFARVRKPPTNVERILITIGGGTAGIGVLEGAVSAVRTAFPDARLLLASGTGISGGDVDLMAFPTPLHEVVGDVDLAVSAAGLTAYELACAGVPAVLLAIAENQRRVACGCAAAGTALAVDAVECDPSESLRGALTRLHDPDLRSAMAARGRRLLDGRGAQRAARALLRCWKHYAD